MGSLKFLDLFCCCGGISKGLNKAFPDAEITGIDITDNHETPYPLYDFMNEDVFDLPLSFFEQFDLIHASPPCQHYSYSMKRDARLKHPDLIARTRELLLKTGKPFTMENIPNSPLRKDLVLCGEMFGLRVIRHRIFEIHGFIVLQPPHIKHRPVIDRTHSYYAQVAGHGGNSYSFKMDDHMEAMGIDWVTDKRHLTQMIPPRYYEYISSFFLSSKVSYQRG